MPKCSYCDSDQHNISLCPVDTDLDKLLDSDCEPNFHKLSLKMLKKIASLTNIKTTVPKLKLASTFKRLWKVRKNKREEELVTVKKELQAINIQDEQKDCQVCMEELGKTDNCTTKCGHRFCSSCLIKWVMKKNSCPVCRSYLIDDKEYYWPIECYVGRAGQETPLQQRGLRRRLQQNIPEYIPEYIPEQGFELEQQLEQHFGQQVEIINDEDTIHEGNMETHAITTGSDPTNESSTMVEYSSLNNDIEDMYEYHPGYNMFGQGIQGLHGLQGLLDSSESWFS